MPQFEVRRNERIPLESSSTAFSSWTSEKPAKPRIRPYSLGASAKQGERARVSRRCSPTQVVRKMHVVERFFKTKAQVRALVVDREVTNVAKKAADSADGCVAPLGIEHFQTPHMCVVKPPLMNSVRMVWCTSDSCRSDKSLAPSKAFAALLGATRYPRPKPG